MSGRSPINPPATWRSNRREFVGGAAAGLALCATPGAAPAQNAEIGARMIERALTFLASLDTPERAQAEFEFGNRTRRAWNYMTGSAFSPGLPLEKMTEPQKAAALDLLATGLSPAGAAKAETVMALQDVLRDELGKGAPDRNRERFSLALYGAPSPSEPWMWRFEGHHLTLSYTLLGDRVVSVTPSSFSSDPNEVASGPYRGAIALVEEESLGRALERDLSPANRRAALIQEQSFGNVLALAGRESRVAGPPRGVPLADLTASQRDIVLRLIEVYAVDHLAAPLAAEQRVRVAEGDVMGARFGWAGPNQDGLSAYYRIHGETFLIEFASLRNQPLHLHTIRHDFERNLGDHALG